jgi:hypothetical protein
LEMVRGSFSPRFFFGLLLVIAVSAIPIFYQQHRRRTNEDIAL